MEEYQLVFLTWLAKFAAFCVAALFVLTFIDRRWRAARGRNSAPTPRPIQGMSHHRTP